MSELTADKLAWKDGIGFYPATPATSYDISYWDKYVSYSRTAMGIALTSARISMVRKWVGSDEPLVDIGIGCGQFLESAGPNTYGYDVNPYAIRWLLDRNLWWDPQFRQVPHVTLWDSLEHIERPDLLLERVSGFLFTSVPIFRDREHAVASKHFRPNEHYWYFTHDGLVRAMDGAGFRLVESLDHETRLGREDIGAYVFQRYAKYREDHNYFRSQVP